MHPTVKHAIETHLAKVTQPGKIVGTVEMKEVQEKLTNLLPDWYVGFLSTCPLACLYLDYPLYEAEGGYDGYVSLKIATARYLLRDRRMLPGTCHS